MIAQWKKKLVEHLSYSQHFVTVLLSLQVCTLLALSSSLHVHNPGMESCEVYFISCLHLDREKWNLHLEIFKVIFQKHGVWFAKCKSTGIHIQQQTGQVCPQVQRP